MTPFILQNLVFDEAPEFVKSNWKSKSNDEFNDPMGFIPFSSGLSPMLLVPFLLFFTLAIQAHSQQPDRFSIEIVDDEALQLLFYDVTHLGGQEGQQGLPDGMKMHSKGYLFASGPGGLWIFNRKGNPIARIYTGKNTSNCAFSNDEKTLFMTADDCVLKMRLE